MNTMNKRYCLIILLLMNNINNIYAQCTGNLLNNGSFTSSVGVGVTAPGWFGTVSPDINDASGFLNTSPCYSWTGTPLVSSDSGTWQNLYGPETVAQNINVSPGQSYILCFEYAAQGIECGASFTFDDPVGVRIYLNGVLSFSTPDDTTQYTWETACFSFTPMSSPLNIKFEPTQTQYVGIDGACLIPEIQAGVASLSSNLDIKFYPNPLCDKLNIQSESNELYELILYDLTSRIILQQEFTSSASLNTGLLAKGIYVYELRNKNIPIKTGKLVKE